MSLKAKKAKKQLHEFVRQQAGHDGVRAYFNRAMLENQPRLTDLIPKSLWAYLAMLLLGIISIYLCQQAHIHTRSLESAEFPKHLFEIAGPGNLASWCMSVMLLILSLGAVFVYLLRRHKADDYKGRYRLWLYLAAFSGFLSFEVATGGHQILSVPLAQFEMTSPWNEASTWWMMMVSLGAMYFSTLLLIEFKSRPGMLMMLAVAVMVMIAAGCSRMGGLIGESTLTTDVAKSSLAMSSALIVSLMTWLNARKVYLNAQQGRVNISQLSQTNQAVVKQTASEIAVAEDSQEKSPAEQVTEWDDWDDLGDDELVETEEDYGQYAEEDFGELDDEPDAIDEEVVCEEAEQDYEEYESYQDEAEVAEQLQQEEEVIYTSYAHEENDSIQSSESTVYETPVDDSPKNTLLIPPKGAKVEHEPFDEEAFWDQYDLTKMSRKQLKTMRKKLNRLKRKHAEKQRAA